MGIGYGAASLLAEDLYRRGVNERRIELIETAGQVFPFHHWIRTAAAYESIKPRVMQEPERSLVLIEQALVTDPYVADLHLARVERLLRLGRMDEASIAFVLLRNLAPRSAPVMGLCGERKDCTVQFVARQQ